MNPTLPILFLLFLIVGILFNFVLFKQDKDHVQSTRFLTSERLLAFAIEIMIALVGFGVTLAITNAYERQVDKEQAALMIEQVIDFTDRQLSREESYLNMYKKETLSAKSLLYSNVISTDYYNNVLSNDVVLQNANMNTYGDIMNYLMWIEQRDEMAQEGPEQHIYIYLEQRHNHLKKMREFLIICHDELSGNITAEEAKQLCHDVKYPSADDTEAAS